MPRNYFSDVVKSASNKTMDAVNDYAKTQKKQGGKNNGSKAPDWMGSAASMAGSMLNQTTQLNETADSGTLGIRNGISDAAINSGVPIAMAIGAATKVVDAIGDATGFHIDDIDKNAAEKAGVNGGITFLNNAMNALPGNSLLWAAFSPSKTIDAKDVNDEGRQVLSSYGGIESDLTAAKALSGKRTLFGIGQDDMNNFINKTNSKVELINRIGRTNALAKQSDYAINLEQQNLNRYAGTNYQMHAVGKNGMKIMSREDVQKILATRKLQKGGVIGTDTSILPEGALHARLNHLQDNPDLEEVTRKGIPVLDENGNQVAEIECNEIVLTLSLTKKLEELMKDGSDESAIEAGRLLSEEILTNTQDNTGQIKDGGVNEQ